MEKQAGYELGLMARALDRLDEFCNPVSNFWVRSLNNFEAAAHNFSSPLYVGSPYALARGDASVFVTTPQVL